MRESLESMLWDFILGNEIASEDELRLVTDINGYSHETLWDVIRCRTTYSDMEQFVDDPGYEIPDKLKVYYGLKPDGEFEE